jgi:hypothetical protein
MAGTMEHDLTWTPDIGQMFLVIYSYMEHRYQEKKETVACQGKYPAFSG